LQAAAPARLATGAVSHAGYGSDAPAQEVFMAWIASVIALVVFCAAPALAQPYPGKPIHILVPYAPGGITDIAARIVGAKLTETWGQQVVVENKPGGNGFIAMTAGAKAAPDGYTLVMVTVGDVAINPAMFKEMPYDVERDLAPIAMVSDAPMVLAANADAPFKSVADAIAAAKAQPGRISVATPGNGSVNQIVLEWMALNTGTQFQHIPYKGGAPAAAALAAGDIPLGVLASSSVAPHVKSGRVRVLAVTMGKRSTLNPEWPTLQQEGVKEVDASNWTALFAPKATPQPVIDKLNAEVVKILHMPDVKERFAGGGVDTIPSSAAELDARVKQEAERFRAIVQKANIRPD
jgi:tripartite-type tricarboxylate transporter receptor subunit TctC